jgi:hypothetical protein
MIDVVYTPEEMALLLEAAEHFHRHGRDYSGSYFEGVDTAVLVETCGDLLEAWRLATAPAKPSWLRIAATLARLRKRPAVRVDRVECGYHVLAEDRLLDLTFSGLSELRHQTKYELASYSENGSPGVRRRYVGRAEVDEARVALIGAVMTKSWPDRAKDSADDFELPEPTARERAETKEALAQLDRLVDDDVVRRQIEQLEGGRAGGKSE